MITVHKPTVILNSDLFFDSVKYILAQNKVNPISLNEYLMRTHPKCFCPQNILQNNKLDSDILSEKINFIKHAAWEVQLEVSYYLIYSTSLNLTIADEEKQYLTNALCYHHLSIAYETIFRFWERIAAALYYLHTAKNYKNKSFDNTILKLEKSPDYDAAIIDRLKRQSEKRRLMTKIRNKFTHFTCLWLSNSKYGCPMSII
ncbi:MAG: hypothetical protein M3R00_08925 [Pseudomonadota bacterium]|nr:hypothetical protein [Pseudomonadota bacterium]